MLGGMGSRNCIVVADFQDGAGNAVALRQQSPVKIDLDRIFPAACGCAAMQRHAAIAEFAKRPVVRRLEDRQFEDRAHRVPDRAVEKRAARNFFLMIRAWAWNAVQSRDQRAEVFGIGQSIHNRPRAADRGDGLWFKMSSKDRRAGNLRYETWKIQ